MKLDFYLKWLATAFICVGALLISINIYPLGPIVSLTGTVLWLIVSVMWREKSLILVNAVVLIIYTVGLISKLC
jgi:hypothetical protein